jgi:hypothetical protein
VLRVRFPPSDRPGPPWTFGSGYVVAPSRALTAAHVLAPPHGSPVAEVGAACEVLVWPCDDDVQWAPATIAWTDTEHDLALLNVPSVADEGAWSAVPFGALEGADPRNWYGVGFPIAGLEETSRRSEGAWGRLSPASLVGADRFALTVESREPVDRVDGETGWAGLSGAAVFCGEHLVGVVTKDPGAWEHSLEASRIAAVGVGTAFATALGVAPIVERADPEPAALPAAAVAKDEPLRVVGARVSALVESWRDRDELRRDLRDVLLRGTPRIVSVFGRRGIGKSATVARVLGDFEKADPTRSPSDDLNALAYLSTRTGGGLTLAQVFETVARLAPDDVADRLMKSWENAGADALEGLWEALRDRKVVVVLDNLDDMQDDAGRLTSERIVALLRSVCLTTYPPRVVTTSAAALNVDLEIRQHMKRLELNDGLPVADAVSLLREIDEDGWLQSSSDALLATVAEKIHCVPLGLQLLALVARDDPAVLDDVIASDEAPSSILAELVSRRFTHLAGTARFVVAMLALAGVPVPMDAIPDLLAGFVDPADATKTLHQLVTSRDVGRDATTVRLHPLDADYVTGRLRADEPDLAVRLERRIADWYANQQRPPTQWRVLDDVTPNRREFDHRWRAGDYDEALSILAQVADFLGRKGESNTLRLAVAAADGDKLSDRGRIDREYCRFCAEFFAGSLDAAETALRAARDLAEGCRLAEVTIHMDVLLATVLRHRGDPLATVNLLAGFMEPTSDIDIEVRLKALLELGLAHCYLLNGAAARAVALCITSLAEHARDQGFQRARANDVLALACLVDGDPRGALAAAEEGIGYYIESPNQDNAGYLRNVRAVAYLALDDLGHAEVELDVGRQLAIDFKIDRLEGLCATNLAWTLLRAGRFDDAATAAQRATDTLERSGVAAAAVGRALGTLLTQRTAAVADIGGALHVAVAAAGSNADVYSPSDAVIAAITAALQPSPAGP